MLAAVPRYGELGTETGTGEAKADRGLPADHHHDFPLSLPTPLRSSVLQLPKLLLFLEYKSPSLWWFRA